VLPRNERITGRMISTAAQQGDELAIAALARSGTFMGIGLADFVHIFNPSIFVIGGGVSQSGHFFLDPMYAALREHLITPQYLEGLTITSAALGDEAGLMGALALARSLRRE
jgi:glucokinase